MDQTKASILVALERRKMHGFGAPARHHGTAAPRDVVRLLVRDVFDADVITPKQPDDRTESGHVVQRAGGVKLRAERAA